MLFSNLKPQRILYQMKHIYWMLKVAKEKFGYRPLRFYFHDLDKIFLLRDKNTHRNKSRHHLAFLVKPENAKHIRLKNVQEMVCDWECARYFKKDKNLNAREFFKVSKEKYTMSPKLLLMIAVVLKNGNF